MKSIEYLIKKAEIKNLIIRTGTTIFKNATGENLKYPAIKHTIAKGNGVVAARIKITQPYFTKRALYSLFFFWNNIMVEIFTDFKYLPPRKAMNPQNEDIIPKINTIKK